MNKFIQLFIRAILISMITGVIAIVTYLICTTMNLGAAAVILSLLVIYIYLGIKRSQI